jgi:hypothetical protein
MDISEVRRRLRGAIEGARREAAARRERSDAAHRDYETFLADRATPIVRQLVLALGGEGHRFQMSTPAGSIRLVSDRSSDDFVEVALDTTQDPPRVVGRANRGRGRGNVTSERAVKEGAAIADLTDEDVLDYLLTEIAALLGR